MAIVLVLRQRRKEKVMDEKESYKKGTGNG